MSFIEAHVELSGLGGTVSINEPVLRYPNNPILTCYDINKVWSKENHLYTYTVHNSGFLINIISAAAQCIHASQPVAI